MNVTACKRLVPAALFVGTLLVCHAAAQLAFDVASIRENTDPNASERLQRTPEGGLMAQHFRPRFLVTIAYRLQPFQLVGMPAWSNGVYYDITAKPAIGSSTTRDQMSDMLQALLVDRFKLQFHRESRQIDGFALVRSRPNELGPALKPSAIDCEKTPAAQPCRVTGAVGSTFVISGASMWSLLQRLIAEVNAPIDDETGLIGTYDINLRWSTDVTAPSDVPALATALQEQLGLKLERRRVTSEIFVVDRFERPSSN